MARITGKNAGLYSVLARTTVSVAAAMTDGGAHTLYTYTGHPYWNPNVPPVITKQTGGIGSFVVQSPVLYTVDYINGTITFLAAIGGTDVVKVNGIEYMTLQSIGNLFDWTLDLKINTQDVTAFQDAFAVKISSIRSWSAAAQGYHVDGYWFDAFAGTGGALPECYVVFYPDVAAAERFIGAAMVDLAIDCKKDAPITEKLTINGTGALSRLTT